MTGHTITDITDIALTFPPLPSWAVPRDNLLHTIDQIFDRGYEAVLLDGAGESGKTVTLAQFCLKHRQSCFSLFLRPSSEVAYDPAYCRCDLTNQIAWFLQGRTISERQYPTAEEYRTLLHHLSLDARRARRYNYFVIDGILDIPNSAVGARAALLEQLPFGLPHTRFLLTGSLDRVPELRGRKLRTREQQISPFSLEETRGLFCELLDDQKVIADLQRRFSTKPGVLASLRRTLEHRGLESLVQSIDEVNANVLFEEWRQNVPIDPQIRLALTAIAFLPTAANFSTLAAIAECDEVVLTSSLARLPYLVINEHRGEVAFAAEEFRVLAKRELVEIEGEVIRRAVTEYSARPLDATVAQILPELLERQGNPKAFVRFLGRENLASIFRSTNSLLSLLSKLKKGQSVAQGMQDHELEKQLCLSRAAVRSLLESTFPAHQIEATLHFSGTDAAARIAHSQISIEDRLHALSLVAKHQKQSSGIEPTTIAEIGRLCELVELGELEERVIEIASIIMHFDAGMAFELLRRATQASDEANGLDQAIAKLSIRSLLSAKETDSTAQALRSMLASKQVDRVEQFSALIGLFADEQNSESLLGEVARLKRTSEKLAVLQQWVRRNHRKPEALKVSAVIVQTVLDDPEYISNASVFRDATLPLLASAQPEDGLINLTAITNSQKTVLMETGPLVDYYRTRFHLARAEILRSNSKSLHPIESDVLELDDIDDLATRLTCLVWLHATLKSLPSSKSLQDELGIVAYAEAETRKTANRILKESAEHVEVMRPVAKALAGVDDVLLCELIRGVNTVDRRDTCYRLAAEYGRENAYWWPSLASASESMRMYCSLVTSLATRYRIEGEFCAWVARAARVGRLNEEIGVDVVELAASINDRALRVHLICELVLCGRLKADEAVAPLVKRVLSEAVREAETPSRRRQVSYIAASALRDIDGALAKEFYFLAGGPSVAPDHARALENTTVVMMKAYSALVRVRAASEADAANMTASLERIESPVVRCSIAGELATSIFSADPAKAREFSQIFVRRIVQEFHRTGQILQPMIKGLIVEISPALWLSHSAYTIQLLGQLESDDRNLALENILRFIVLRQTINEPYKSARRKAVEVTEESIADAIAVLAEVTSDGTFYAYASTLLEAIRDKSNLGKFSKVQSAEYRRRLEGLAREKLPAATGIPHEGYLVLTLAQLLACEKTADSQWTELIERARALPNLADAAFVCAALTGIIPSRNVQARRIAFDASEGLIPKLPLAEDRVDRSEVLLREAWDLSPGRCKHIAKTSLASSMKVDRGAVRERRLSLIELAHRFDEELAAALASLSEEHKASASERGEMKERMSTLKLVQELGKREWSGEVERTELDALVEGCGRAWGLINGGMVIQSSIQEITTLLLRSGDVAISDAVELHGYVVEATFRRYRTSREGPEYVRALFELYTGSLKLMWQLHDLMQKREEPELKVHSPSTTESRFVVTPGSRQDALTWIRSWLTSLRPSELLIVDAYFGADDLSALELIQQEQPDCSVTVITTSKGNGNVDKTQMKTRYDHAWKSISLGQEPDAQIVVVNSDTDVTAELHDRWWLGDRGGLTFGTSFNSLGAKLSEIHALDVMACTELRAALDPYLNLRRRSSTGARLSFEVFNLG